MESKTLSIKDFQIIKELGSGSFGKVHLVRRKSDESIYAMKSVLMTRLSQTEKDSALNQVRLLASINAPNVISFIGSFYNSENQTLCVIMEFADGGDLQGKITQKFKNEDEQGFDETFIWKVAFEIFQGLKVIHSHNIIHRDIKSANIFFVNGITKLGDLNVSKVTENGMCSTQTGTPYYTSPEIWKGTLYGRKCDIWSTGCLLYEMCTLHPPFKAKDFPSLYRKVIVGNFDPIPSHYSSDLSKLIRMCLTVDEDIRPDASQLLETGILSGMEMNLEKFRSRESSVRLIDPIKCPQVLRFLNNKLPQGKFECKAKKTVGFATRKEIKLEKRVSIDKDKKYKITSKARSEKIIAYDNQRHICKIGLGSKNKVFLPPLEKEVDEPLRFSEKKIKVSEKRTGSRRVIIAEKENTSSIKLIPGHEDDDA